MIMTEWAEKEVELALEREIAAIENDTEETDEDMKEMGKQYAECCYASALKAYRSLMKDEHSGYSFSVTRGILKRLLDGYPLTPIEDIPESWGLVHETGETVTYRCKRCHSLFKKVDKKTGDVTFDDVDRIICTNSSGICWTNGFISKKISEIHPIEMPYRPTGRYYVSAFDFAVSGTPGEFDTMEIKSVKCPDGKVEILNWYFKEVDGQFTPIDADEYNQRYEQFQDNVRNRSKDIDKPENGDKDDQTEVV